MFHKVSESVSRILLMQHDWNTEKILERYICIDTYYSYLVISKANGGIFSLIINFKVY